MNIRIYPSKIKGTITAPPSKSITHRAIIIASLAKGDSELKDVLFSDDTLKTIEACKSFGVKIIKKGNNLKIKGSSGLLKAPKKPINLGNSGSSMRMIAAVAALAKGKTVLTGGKRLCERPMGDLIIALKELGIKVKSLNNNNCAPMEITGGILKGGNVTIPGNISSQYISSLLLVSPFAKKPLKIIVQNILKSKPYVALTLEVMKSFGIDIINNNFKEFVTKNNKIYQAKNYKIEGDYSSVSYFFAAAAVTGGTVCVKNLNKDSTQGDAYFLDILKKMGCKISKTNNQVIVVGTKELLPITIDMGDFPDIVQTLAIVAAKANGISKITNISHLKYKESDRINNPAKELKKMGAEIEISKDSITIKGGKLTGAKIETYNDHRMAMSFAVAALYANGETVIRNTQVVDKSYPGFFDDLEKIGVKIKIV